LSNGAIRPPNPIVGDRKFPIRSGHIERDCNLTFNYFIGERMLPSQPLA
jgi:hypothetical protein